MTGPDQPLYVAKVRLSVRSESRLIGFGRMDLTSFLLSEQGELSLDAFTDSMLANLPQQAEGICSLDPVVPFQGQAGKAPGVHKMRGSGGVMP